MLKTLNRILNNARNTVKNVSKNAVNKTIKSKKKLPKNNKYNTEKETKDTEFDIENIDKEVIFLMYELMKFMKETENLKNLEQHMKVHPSEPLISPKDAIKKMPSNIKPVTELSDNIEETINTLGKSCKKRSTNIKRSISKKDKTKTNEVAFDKQSNFAVEDSPFAPPTSPKPPRLY